MNTLANLFYSVQDIRAIERIAIEDYHIDSFQLMQTAAEVVFKQLTLHYPQTRSITVICGAGNNAGDGYCVAKLALLSGYQVIVYALTTQLTGDALLAYQHYQQLGGKILSFNSEMNFTTDIIIDAIFGSGLNRPIHENIALVIDKVNRSSIPVIAIDIASGLAANTGQIYQHAIKADLTITFIGLKLGLFTNDGQEYSGQIIYHDLNIPAAIFNQFTPIAEKLLPIQFAKRHRNSHKGIYGHLGIIGGDIGYAGAVRLAAESGLRCGAGLVSIATRQIHVLTIIQGCFELMAHGIETSNELLRFLAKLDVIVLGPGLAQQTWGKMIFDGVIQAELPMVIDADGLNHLAQFPKFYSNWILTPHVGEAARLLNCNTQTIRENRLVAIQKIQQKYGGVCVLKGCGSLIYDGKNAYIATEGNSGMSTAGMGDVLAGMIGSFIAQGYSLIEATKAGVYFHNAAADLAAQNGERGIIASDLFSYFKQLIN
ncbi:MAG: hypothetical protein RL637_767 [Pseudomonadota bacterium]